jgi:hypothetical protein
MGTATPFAGTLLPGKEKKKKNKQSNKKERTKKIC